jgi:hypothetical protein
MERKFWPKVKYGLCANNSPYDTLVRAMDKPYYILCPLGGVIRSAKREIRYLDSGFYGVGFPQHWGAEAIMESLNKFLTHYGTTSLLGTQYQMSTELLAIELGISAQPFLQDYQKYEKWVTDCTLKELWARCHRFSIRIKLGNLPMRSPREGDRWFMSAIEKIGGFSAQEKEIINRVRLSQEVVFESDVFAPDGRHLDEKYLRRRAPGESWSSWLFAQQKIPPSHFNLWKQALHQLAPGGRRPRNLGKFIGSCHKNWEWRYVEGEDRLLRSVEGGMSHVEYSRANNDARRGRNARYVAGDTVTVENPGNYCCVREHADGSVQILSHIKPVLDSEAPANFMEVLKEWGCTWLWKDMKMTNSIGSGVEINAADGGEWIYQAIEEGTLVGVTDGSYIRELYPHLSSAAVILECSKGRGRLVLSFAEKCLKANAYRGELLGLMALHLLLLSFNKTRPNLRGSVHIYSDCLGALNKVEHLPPGCIPSRCRHSDILKNILVNCSNLTFQRFFSHVKAHQDDHLDHDEMEHEA